MLQSVKCNLCGADHYRILYQAQPGHRAERAYTITEAETGMPERIVQCLRCGLIYASPRRSTRELLTSYRQSVDQDYVEEELGRRLAARVTLRMLTSLYQKTGLVLDVGCATGFLLDEARKQGWDVEGVELSTWAADLAQRTFQLKVFRGILKDAAFSSYRFDAVILKDAIEHLTDPRETLIEIRRILKPQGILCINTPNIGSWISRLFKARWWGINEYHLFYFTASSLRMMLDAAGFEVIKARPHRRAFTLGYWAKRVAPHHRFLGRLLARLASHPWLSRRVMWVTAYDQIEVFARRKRTLANLPELEAPQHRRPTRRLHVIVVLPAYNAEQTLRKTVEDIPKDLVDEILLVDDASCDRTVEVARQLGLTVFRHPRNLGYGANQKTCYTKALERGADVVVMVHPDYQYDPKAIPALIEPIRRGEAEAVFGSRMLKGGALEGGMPLWKHNCNIIFTAFANVLLGTYLSEYHSGFRAYSARALRSIRFLDNSDNFVFDTEVILQLQLHHLKIEEVPIRTRYFEEASVITLWAGFWYGVDILWVLLKYGLHRSGIVTFRQFQ